ncbi:MAG TPA: transposase family protein [Kofleriaceae bacterium]|nr:transposase family protein [Kofleriaceae bacterium]
MMLQQLQVLAALDDGRLDILVDKLSTQQRFGRPWARSLRQRVLLVCVALRTNLTFRELAAVFQISKSAAHRVVAAMTPKLAALATGHDRYDRRFAWIVDGTLIPTRDHRAAARSKNYRWSCNAQLLVRHRDLFVVATSAAGPGNRNDPIHYRGSVIEQLCRLHTRVLADGGYPGVRELVTPRFVRTGSSAIAGGDNIDCGGPASST